MSEKDISFLSEGSIEKLADEIARPIKIWIIGFACGAAYTVVMVVVLPELAIRIIF